MAAIYIPPWPIAEQFTTTLYPVDTSEFLQLGAVIGECSTKEIPKDYIGTTSKAMLDGTYEQKRWFYEYTIGVDYVGPTGKEMLDGTYIQKRWFYELTIDADYIGTTGKEMLDGTYIRKKVIADSPLELLQLNATISASCSMEAV